MFTVASHARPSLCAKMASGMGLRRCVQPPLFLENLDAVGNTGIKAGRQMPTAPQSSTAAAFWRQVSTKSAKAPCTDCRPACVKHRKVEAETAHCALVVGLAVGDKALPFPRLAGYLTASTAALAACELHTRRSHSVPTRLHNAAASCSFVGLALQLVRAASQTFCTFNPLQSPNIYMSKVRGRGAARLPTRALASHASKRLEMTLKATGPRNLGCLTSSLTFKETASILPSAKTP